MLKNQFHRDIELHKNNLRLDIAWFKMLVFEAIFDNYNKDKMIFLQQEIVLKEYYLNLFNANNFEKISSQVTYKMKKKITVNLN